MGDIPKMDRFLFWLLERKPGESEWRASVKLASLMLAGMLAVVAAFELLLWLVKWAAAASIGW